MALVDHRGMPVSSSNRASLERFERALDLSLSFTPDPLAAVEELVRDDPDFLMGHCLKAALAVMSSERGALPLLADAVAAVETRAAQANDRERTHAAAGRAWLEGDFARAVRLYGDILLDHPRDLVALQAAHVGDFLLGASQMLRDRVAQVIPRWGDELPGYGYVLGMYAFGLEEMGNYSRAEDTGRRALALSRRDPWAVHAVTHVMEMQGRLHEGISWLGGREDDWAREDLFAYHLWWHLTLYHLDLGDHHRVLEIYDQRIRPKATSVAYENIDASALLWRLHLRGVDVGPRWQALSEGWAPLCEDAFYAFNDVHAVMAFVGAGREDLVARTLAAMGGRQARGATDAGTNVMMTRDVGLPLARALVAFARGRYGECADELLEVRTIAHRFGGSHAQRDLVHLTLVEAALRAGRTALARALAAERTELKPQSPFNWLLTARALENGGNLDAGAAVRARDEASLRRRAQLAAAATV